MQILDPGRTEVRFNGEWLSILSFADVLAPTNFFEGILQNGAGPYFDGVSYHGYDYYQVTPGKSYQYYNPNWGTAKDTTGPTGTLKAQFLRNLLTQYGLGSKYLMNTEAAVICGPDSAPPPPICLTDDHEMTLAVYIAQLYATGKADGISAMVWYNVLGWRASGILNSDLSPRMSYNAFKTSQAELSGAIYLGSTSPAIGVLAYKFARGAREVWVIWATDDAIHSVQMPGAPLLILDTLGAPQTLVNPVEVGSAPVYVEMAR
jgi:hypothetical protein